MQQWTPITDSLQDAELLLYGNHADLNLTLKDAQVMHYRLEKREGYYSAIYGDLQYTVKILSDTRFKFSISNINKADGFLIDNQDLLSPN